MFEEFQYTLLESISVSHNINVKKNNTFDYYLEKLTKPEVYYTLISPMATNQKSTEFIRTLLLKSKSKNEIIKSLKKQLDKNISLIYPFFDNATILGIEKLIENDGFLENPQEFPIKCLMTLCSFNLAFVKVKKNNLSIHCPKEILDIFKCVMQKDFHDTQKKNNEINNFVTGLLDVYGIAKLDWLHHLYITNFDNINLEEFRDIITAYIFIEKYLIIIPDDEGNDYCTTGDEDTAYEMLYSINEKYDYQTFSKYDIQKLMDNSYLENLKSSQKLISYLKKNFKMDKESIKSFISEEVHNFIMLSQEDSEKASSFLDSILDKLFEIDFNIKNDMMKLINKIWDEYPKFYLKGHAK